MATQEDQLRRWLADALNDFSFAQKKNSLFDLLKDGVALCQLLNQLGLATAEYKKKPNNKQARENVDSFLHAIWTLELELAEQPTSYESLFPSDKDVTLLLDTLAALKAYQSKEEEVEITRTTIAFSSPPLLVPQMTQLDDFPRQTHSSSSRNSIDKSQDIPLEIVRMSAANFSMSDDAMDKVVAWIFDVLGQKPKKVPLNKLLMEGTTMLDILNVICPCSVKSKKHFRFAKTFDAYQKVVVDKLGIAQEDMVKEQDIDGKFNPKKIAAHFYVLCTVAKSKFGYSGPSLVPDETPPDPLAPTDANADQSANSRASMMQRLSVAATCEADEHVLLEWAASKMQECDSRGSKKKNWSKLSLSDFKDCTIFLNLLEYLTGSSVGYFYRSPHNAKEIQHNAKQLFIFAGSHMEIPPGITSNAIIADTGNARLRLLDAIRQHFDLDYMFHIAIQDKKALAQFDEEAEKIRKRKMKVSVPIGSHRSVMIEKEPLTPISPRRVKRQVKRDDGFQSSAADGSAGVPLVGPPATSWPSLDVVLSDPMLRGDFCAFLESEGALSFLTFYEDINRFMQKLASNPPPQSVRASADKLTLEYLGEGSPHQLAISWESKADVIMKLRGCGTDVPPDLWDRAYSEVAAVLRDNLFIAWAGGLQPPPDLDVEVAMSVGEFAELEQLSEAALKVLVAKESVRNHAIEQLLRSEKQYVQDLIACVENVEIPLASSGLLTQDEIYQAFNVLSLLQSYHKNLLARLEAAAAKRKEGKMAMIGQVFLENTGFLLLYSLYSRSYTHSTLFLRQTLSVRPPVNEIVKKFESSAGNDMLIHDLLSVPCRRIGVYESLFSSILKFTPQMHPDYDGVQYCLGLVSKLASDIMDCQDEREARSMEMMLHLSDTIVPDPEHPLIVPGRKLVYYGDVTMVRISESGNTLTPEGVEEESMIVLFNDIIICCTKVEQKDDSKYSYQIADCMAISEIDELTLETVMKPLVQIVAKNGEIWIFSSPDGPERTEVWSKFISSLRNSTQQE